MASMERSIDVDVAVESVYDQWTQFEHFPMFMEGVEDVRQVDERNRLWRAETMGRVTEWRAEVTEQVPDQRIAWRGRVGVHPAGVVTFHRLTPDRTRVMLRIEYEPESMTDLPATVAARVEGDLRRFKTFIETRGESPGDRRRAVSRRPPWSPGRPE
jgi:uncharacterized membrane protein